MAPAVKQGKGKKAFGRRVKSGGSPAKRTKKHVWLERPSDRCACHHSQPCPREL